MESSRAYVAKASNGQLGYVHMFDMSDGALEQLHLDLDAENHAQRTGWSSTSATTTAASSTCTRSTCSRAADYLNMTPRGYPTVSARTLLGQRALELPTILVTNQHSLSDAEDFTEGYRTLKLGKVVGEPTAGWIIYTGAITLVDGVGAAHARHAGSWPPTARRWRCIRGRWTSPVKRPVGESYTAKDAQLDTAVAELLKQLGTGGARTSPGGR